MNLFTQKVINKALKEKPWVRRVGPNRYRVTPRTAVHGKYELMVYSDEQGNPVVTKCTNLLTKEPCKGFEFDHGNCYHSARLQIHLNTAKRRCPKAA